MNEHTGSSVLHSESGKHQRRRTFVICVAVSLGLLTLFTAGGNNWRARAFTTRLVSPFGDDLGGTNDCTSPDQPCATIQHAISESGSGDLISLAPGSYLEDVLVSGDVTIQGDGTLSSTIDGKNSDATVVINEGVTATLASLIITNGSNSGVINSGGTLTITNATINGNSASSGGGINNPSGGTLTVINSTINGNSASQGGGIDNGGTATVVNTTISSNTGGGVLNQMGATLNLTNTIIGGSTVAADCVNSGTVATNLNNLIQDGSCSPAVSGNPNLGPLQINGGPTPTRALLAGSPAINAGDDSVLGDPFNLEFDQRSFGFPRKACTHVDIGAYEFGSAMPPTVTCPGNITVPVDSGMSTATVSFTVTATDLCDGTLTPACTVDGNPITSPHAFPVGQTFISCSAINSSGLTGMCGFTVTVTPFNTCIQDDSTRDVLSFNSTTGQYQFTRCSTGFTLSGTGVVTTKGSTVTLVHNAPDRRITATLDKAGHKGSASIQVNALHATFSITDRNTLNDTCTCQF